jgi:hypothetical protein
MKRNNTLSVLNHESLSGYKQKIAYHEAGHATAIHFNNGQQHLPPVFFQIIFEDLEEWPTNNLLTALNSQHDYIAKVKGGRLIQALPIPLDNWNRQPSADNHTKGFYYTDDYRLALEADIVNLLIGPLAEAKYVALMDDEPFQSQLLSVQSLKYYGGEDDLAIVNDYLQSYSADKQTQERSLNQFLMQAFNFVNDKTNWKAITQLANYILDSHKNRISSEEVAIVLDGNKRL